MMDMNLVVVGHVDHGKSTIVGRLMADTGSVPQGKIESIRNSCKYQSKTFEYAYLLDALKDEQAQGITIDTARCFFKTNKRNYLLKDAPGHVEFLKNMITGASTSDAALLVIDAIEGIKENTKRHGYLLALLGIKQIIILVNKMDLLNYSQNAFESIVLEFNNFLSRIKVSPTCYIPVSGLNGDNITTLSKNMPWFIGNHLLQAMDNLVDITGNNQSFRMPVQDVYKFTDNNDNRRIIAGTIISGKIKVGDKIRFYPSGKQSSIKSIESYNKIIKEAQTGDSCGFILNDELYLQRGEIAFHGEEPICSTVLSAKIFWLDNDPLKINKSYIIKIGHNKCKATIEEIKKSIDAVSLIEQSTRIELNKNCIIECVIRLDKPIALDLNIIETSRFVLIDNYEVSAGGIVLAINNSDKTQELENTQLRNQKWIYGLVSIEDRIKRYRQIPRVIIVTGSKESQRKELAMKMEKILFDAGYITYFLGMGNFLYSIGLNAEKTDFLQLFSELAYVLLSSGLILIISAANLSQEDINMIKQHISDFEIFSIFMGDCLEDSNAYNIVTEQNNSTKNNAIKLLKEMKFELENRF